MFLDEAQVTAPAVVDPARKLALDAAERLERYGWVQSATHSPKGSCIVGAISACAAYGDVDREIRARLQDSLSLHVGESQLWKWNDKRGRTKEEVVGLLRAYGNGEIK
jgi:hypothetical protein